MNVIIKILIFFIPFLLFFCGKISDNKNLSTTKEQLGVNVKDTSFVSLDIFCKNKPKVEKIEYEFEPQDSVFLPFMVNNKQKGIDNDYRDSILVVTRLYKTQYQDLIIKVTQENGEGLIKNKYPNILRINNKLFFVDSLTKIYSPPNAFYLSRPNFYILSFKNKIFLILYFKDGNIQNSSAIQEPLFIFDITDKNNPKFLFYDVNFTRNIHCFCDFDNDGLLNYITSDDIYSGKAYSYTIKNGIFIKDKNIFKLSLKGELCEDC